LAYLELLVNTGVSVVIKIQTNSKSCQFE
jgi:hypothetical protein